MQRLEDLPALLTYRQVAEQLGVSDSKAKRLVKDGVLPSVDVGERSRRIRRTDLASYVEHLAPRPA